MVGIDITKMELLQWGEKNSGSAGNPNGALQILRESPGLVAKERVVEIGAGHS